MFRAFDAQQVTAAEYQQWMDAGFRRSGSTIYQPICSGCRDCTPIRVPVEQFAPSKSQRRVIRHNRDLVITVGPPQATAEKWQLYDRYQREWHDGAQAGDPLAFINFLYRSPVESLEFEYRDPRGAGGLGKIVGIGLCDVTPQSVSSVYYYFDPEESGRSPGTFSALYEILWAKSMKLAHWYAGYYIPGCARMNYKSRFHPAEILSTDGVWRPFEVRDPE